jgi:hypothetical protein
MRIGDAVKVMIGMRAKGSCSDIKTLRRSLRLVMSSIPLNTGKTKEKY